MEALIDNDILLKAACYALLGELFSQNFSSTDMLGVLGATRFVVTKTIRKRVLKNDPEAAIQRLDAFIDRVTTVELTPDEQIMAADFELAALRAGVALDIGESQLCAVVVTRALHHLYTGDKRAIHAMERLLESDTRLRLLFGKVICLEQLVLQSISENNTPVFRTAICSEPEIDKTLTICFGCTSMNTSLEGIKEGLNSYISDLRKRAQQILAS